MTTYEDLQQADIHEIPRPECLNLLGLSRVGRVAFNDDEGPLALPVNFRMDGDAVVFRVSPASSMCARLDGATVAFEVDRLDDFHQTGWSVVVRGTASYVDRDDLPEHLSALPMPWVRGLRPVYVRITPTHISGRRLVDA